MRVLRIVLIAVLPVLAFGASPEGGATKNEPAAAPARPQGNLGRNTLPKGSIRNINAMVSRTFPVGPDRQVVFRAESVNFFNTPQFAYPGRSLSSDDFASITNTLNDGRAFRRLMQLYF
jgi:hypothetical protein